MKIGIVARNITKGGAGRYTNELINNLSELANDGGNFDLYIFTNSDFEIKNLKNTHTIKSKFKNKLFYDLIYLPIILSKYNLDCVIYPKQIIPLTHKFLKFKKLVIIHDFIYFEKEFRNEWPIFDTMYIKLFQKFSILNSDAIVCVSSFTKASLEKFFNIKDKRIEVIYESVNKKKFKCIRNKSSSEIRRKYNIKKPFILYCGSISKRKNIGRLLLAFKKALQDNDLDLVISSWLSNDNELFEIIERLGISKNVKVLGYTSEYDLIRLYNLAELYIFPSLYEGFGLTILEAQACGCPVIGSNIMSITEIGGSGVYCINPYDYNEISKAIIEIINDDNLKKNLIRNGFKNIRRFSWEKTGKEVFDLCKEVHNEK